MDKIKPPLPIDQPLGTAADGSLIYPVKPIAEMSREEQQAAERWAAQLLAEMDDLRIEE